MILKSHREWLAIVRGLPESQLPCDQSTVAYAIEVAARAVEAHDLLLESEFAECRGGIRYAVHAEIVDHVTYTTRTVA